MPFWTLVKMFEAQRSRRQTISASNCGSLKCVSALPHYVVVCFLVDDASAVAVLVLFVYYQSSSLAANDDAAALVFGFQNR